MQYVWIVMLVIAYIITSSIAIAMQINCGVIWIPDLDDILYDHDWWDVWLWLHELALIGLFIFSLVKFIAERS